MNFAVEYGSEKNAIINHNGILLVRQAMIGCGLVLNTNGFWEITELLEHLKDTIQHDPMEFAEIIVQ